MKVVAKHLIWMCMVLAMMSLMISCGLYKRIRYNCMNTTKPGYQPKCKKVSLIDTTAYRLSELESRKFDFQNGDTIVSIGVGSGVREFMFSVFTDSLTFYLEDLDTSCITRKKIQEDYIPHYSAFRGSLITNTFIPAIGTDTSVNIESNVADMILIINVYHHFTHDNAMVKECYRILKPNGRLFIHDAVMKREKISFRFCGWGGFYKSEKNFVEDIENIGFKCDSIQRYDKNFRGFYFHKE